MNRLDNFNKEGIERNFINNQPSRSFTNRAAKENPASSLQSLGKNNWEVAEATQIKIDTLTFSFTKEQLPNGWHEKLTCRNGEVKSLQKDKFITEGNQIIEHTLKPSELNDAKWAVNTACKIVQEKKVELQNQMGEFQNPPLPKTWREAIKDFFQGIYDSIKGFFSWMFSWVNK